MLSSSRACSEQHRYQLSLGVFEGPAGDGQGRSPAEGRAASYQDGNALEHKQRWTLLLNTQQDATHPGRVYKGHVYAAAVRMGELFHDALH
jgi:hypothetical protein